MISTLTYTFQRKLYMKWLNGKHTERVVASFEFSTHTISTWYALRSLQRKNFAQTKWNYNFLRNLKLYSDECVFYTKHFYAHLLTRWICIITERCLVRRRHRFANILHCPSHPLSFVELLQIIVISITRMTLDEPPHTYKGSAFYFNSFIIWQPHTRHPFIRLYCVSSC